MTTLLLDGIDVPSALRGSEALSTLTEAERADLAGHMTVVALGDGDEVTRQGAPCEALYIVLSGTVAVSTTDKRGRVHLVEDIGPGGLVGDRGMFLHAPAGATTRARGAAQLAELPKAGLEAFKDRFPAAALVLADALGPGLRRAG